MSSRLIFRRAHGFIMCALLWLGPFGPAAQGQQPDQPHAAKPHEDTAADDNDDTDDILADLMQDDVGGANGANGQSSADSPIDSNAGHDHDHDHDVANAGDHHAVDEANARDDKDKEPENRTARASDANAFGAAEAGVSSGSVAEARAHFEQGVDYYAEGDYRAALIELQRAYRLYRTYKLLYNLGQVAYELRDYAGAERYFRDYLAKGGNELVPERRREVQQELARLRGRVATLHLEANEPGARFRVDDREVLHPQGAVRVSAGRRRVRAEKPGFSPVERVVDVTGGEDLDVHMKFGLPLVAASSGGSLPREQSGSRVMPWVTGITAGVLAVAAGGVGFAAYQDVSARDDALNRFTPRSELDSLSSRAHTKALVADALLGAAVVSAAVTVVLVLSGGGKPDKQSVQLRTPRGAPTLRVAF